MFIHFTYQNQETTWGQLCVLRDGRKHWQNQATKDKEKTVKQQQEKKNLIRILIYDCWLNFLFLMNKAPNSLEWARVKSLQLFSIAKYNMRYSTDGAHFWIYWWECHLWVHVYVCVLNIHIQESLNSHTIFSTSRGHEKRPESVLLLSLQGRTCWSHSLFKETESASHWAALVNHQQ